MKYFICFLFIFSLNCFAESDSEPRGKSEFIKKGCFEYSGMSGIIDWVITDKETGCQYLVIQNETTPLGCFDKYKR